MTCYSAFEKSMAKEGIAFTEKEPLSLRTTIGIGGAADYFVCPRDASDLIKTARIAQKCGVPYFLLGRGSNLLVSDFGIRGCVISTEKLNGISIERVSGGTVFIRAFAGASLNSLVKFCRLRGLSGTEFLCGVPASVGGAVRMNAGCFGSSVSDITDSVCAFGAEVMNLSASECAFVYRQSRFALSGEIVISALFRTKTASLSEVERNVSEYKERRAAQAKGRSMGCVFKNGERPAGMLIEQAGFKGARVGGAYVSERHANFIINDGTATAADVWELIGKVKSGVKARTGADLKEEIELWGVFK